MNIDGLRSLTVFVRVVQDGGFTAAAVTLGVSTSAVSQAIRQLEKEAGVRLLNRTTRSVGLSEAGAEFYHRGRAAAGAGGLESAGALVAVLFQSRLDPAEAACVHRLHAARVTYSCNE